MNEDQYTDDTDVSQPQQRIAELENRIEQLEATTKKMMPTRRDALKYGGAAAIGAAAMSGTASAGSSQIGTIGDASNLVDVEAEDINVSDTINGASVSGAAAGEALTSDGSGGLTFADAGGGVPPNFSYNDVESSRSLDTTFSNNTGKALYVAAVVLLNQNSNEIEWRVFINNNLITRYFGRLNTGEYDSLNNYRNINFFVPDGGTYKIEDVRDSFLLTSWYEAEM